MAGYNHHQHAQRHDDDIAVLQDQIGQIKRTQQSAVGRNLKEGHDCDQGQQHAVLTHIIF